MLNRIKIIIGRKVKRGEEKCDNQVKITTTTTVRTKIGQP
jgi:hypothetical protein